MHEELDDRFRGLKDAVEENETNDDGLFFGEAEVAVHALVSNEDGEQEEDVERLHLTD